SQRLTRSHHSNRPRFTSLTTRSQQRDHGVTLFKTCTAEVFRPIWKDENRSFQVFEIRKDSAVHVSLSSSSLVKQPGAGTPLPSGSFPHGNSLNGASPKASLDDK